MRPCLRVAVLSDLQGDILRTLAEQGPLQRATLVALLQAPRSTIFDNLMPLVERGLVETRPVRQPNRGQGRPFVVFALKEAVSP